MLTVIVAEKGMPVTAGIHIEVGGYKKSMVDLEAALAEAFDPHPPEAPSEPIMELVDISPIGVSLETKPQKVYHTSKVQTYQTPLSVMKMLHAGAFKFVFDLCATADTAQCTQYSGPDHEEPLFRDSFDLHWEALVDQDLGWLWMNPPYNDIDKWMAKAMTAVENGARIVALLPSRTDRPWFQKAVEMGYPAWFFSHRLKFVGQKNVAPFPSVLLILSKAHKGTAPSILHVSAKEFE